MSEKPSPIPVNQAFDPVERQAQKDLDAYMESRPYQDEKGNIHDPVSNQFINSDKYFDGQREAAMDNSQQTAYENVPTTVLAKKLAEAEVNGDRTSAANIEDAMLTKAAEQDEKERQRDPNRDDSESDKLLDHLTDIKNKELERLKGLKPESGEEEPTFQRVFYKPNEQGVATTAVEVTKEGEAFDLGVLGAEGKALLTTDDTAYYVHGKYVDDLMKVRNGQEGDNHGWEVHETDKLPSVKIGEPLTIHGKEQEGAIKKIEVLTGEHAADALKDGWEARGDDPFAQADALLEEMLGAEDDTKVMDESDADAQDESDDTPLMPEDESEDKLLFEPGGFRARIRNAMAGAAAAIQVRLASAQEYMNDEDNGRRRKIIGGVVGVLALGGAAYAGSKGLGLFDGHSSEMGSLTVKPHHQEAMHNALGNGGTTYPASSLHGSEAFGNGGTTAPGAHNVELRPGQNPWTVSEHRLHELGLAHPTDAQIEHYDKLMAHANPDVYSYEGESSEDLPVGTVLRLPR